MISAQTKIKQHCTMLGKILGAGKENKRGKKILRLPGLLSVVLCIMLFNNWWHDSKKYKFHNRKTACLGMGRGGPLTQRHLEAFMLMCTEKDILISLDNDPAIKRVQRPAHYSSESWTENNKVTQKSTILRNAKKEYARQAVHIHSYLRNTL